MEIFTLGCRVRHIAWGWTGTIMDFPFEHHRQCHVVIKRNDTGQVTEQWVPSLIVLMDDEEEVEFDEW